MPLLSLMTLTFIRTLVKRLLSTFKRHLIKYISLAYGAVASVTCVWYQNRIFFRCDVGKGIRQNRGDNLYQIEKRPEVCSFFGPQTRKKTNKECAYGLWNCKQLFWIPKTKGKYITNFKNNVAVTEIRTLDISQRYKFVHA